MRLHSPIPHAVILRVAGTVDLDNATLLTRRGIEQFDRAAHVVLDLSDVQVLHHGAVHALVELHRHACDRGVAVHVAGTDHDPVGEPLRRAGVEQELDLVGSADALVALLRHDTRRHDTRPLRAARQSGAPTRPPPAAGLPPLRPTAGVEEHPKGATGPRTADTR